MRWTGSSIAKILIDIVGLRKNPADATERLQLMKLLAEEEAKFKSDAPAGRSRVTAATEHRVRHDGEEQHSGG